MVMLKATSLILAFSLLFFFFFHGPVSSESDPDLDRAINRSYINATDVERMYPLIPTQQAIQEQQKQSTPIQTQGNNSGSWILILIVSNVITFIVALLIVRWYG